MLQPHKRKKALGTAYQAKSPAPSASKPSALYHPTPLLKWGRVFSTNEDFAGTDSQALLTNERHLSRPGSNGIIGRWRRLQMLRPYTSRTTTKVCGLYASGSFVEVIKSDTGKPAIKGALHYCQSRLCPLCQSRVSASNIHTLERASSRIMKEMGGKFILFSTFTLPHQKTSSLKSLIDALNKGIHAAFSGRGRKMMKDYGLLHYARFLDITYSEQNGWHPHIHMISWWSKSLSTADQRHLQNDAYARFSKSVGRSIKGAVVARSAIDYQEANEGDAVVRYVSKHTIPAFQEALLSQNKVAWSGDTIWDVQDKACTGDEHYLKLLLELETATHRRRWVSLSHGLSALGTLTTDDSETHPCEGTQEPEVLLKMPSNLWKAVARLQMVDLLLLACGMSVGHFSNLPGISAGSSGTRYYETWHSLCLTACSQAFVNATTDFWIEYLQDTGD